MAEPVDEFFVVALVPADSVSEIRGWKTQLVVTYAASCSFSSSSFDRRACCRIVSSVAPPLLSPICFFGAPACMTAQSLATRSNSFGLRMSMLATSASCGSFGSGVLRRDWSEIRADLMVRTGDQAVERVSRQIAPYKISKLDQQAVIQ